MQAAYLGFFVDMFDVYLPIAVLAPALPYFIPSGLSGAAQASIFYVVFAVTLIGRPLRLMLKVAAGGGAGSPMPYEYSPILLLALGGLLLSVGALAGPETKDADFCGAR